MSNTKSWYCQILIPRRCWIPCEVNFFWKQNKINQQKLTKPYNSSSRLIWHTAIKIQFSIFSFFHFQITLLKTGLKGQSDKKAHKLHFISWHDSLSRDRRRGIVLFLRSLIWSYVGLLSKEPFPFTVWKQMKSGGTMRKWNAPSFQDILLAETAKYGNYSNLCGGSRM